MPQPSPDPCHRLCASIPSLHQRRLRRGRVGNRPDNIILLNRGGLHSRLLFAMGPNGAHGPHVAPQAHGARRYGPPLEQVPPHEALGLHIGHMGSMGPGAPDSYGSPRAPMDPMGTIWAHGGPWGPWVGPMGPMMGPMGHLDAAQARQQRWTISDFDMI